MRFNPRWIVGRRLAWLCFDGALLIGTSDSTREEMGTLLTKHTTESVICLINKLHRGSQCSQLTMGSKTNNTVTECELTGILGSYNDSPVTSDRDRSTTIEYGSHSTRRHARIQLDKSVIQK